ncbi:MAG: winged helix-turn-helix domain-containing protein [Anaerolineae bacterium]|nr:winged helix-turn-helix domain-containing protein [Anaerolineae bacterium]
MSGKAGPQAGIGLAAFSALHAEMEEWLEQCMVLPPDFDLIAGGRSYLVIGRQGSGKTALFRALCGQLEPPAERREPPPHLAVRWRPPPLQAGLVGKEAALSQLQTVLWSCADALLAYLARWPDGFQAAPPDVRDTLVWFICHTLSTGLERRMSAHLRNATPGGAALLHRLPLQPASDQWLETAQPNELIAELIKALRIIGPEMIYILVSPDDLGDSTYLSRDMGAFLSSLTLFENAGFIYKVVMDTRLMESIGEATAVDRRRIELATLTWEREDLREIVLARLRLATGRQISNWDEVCEDRQLGQWLERTGGDSPRGWLQSIKPLMVWYLRWQRPVTAREWRRIRQDPPPALRYDKQSGAITVGWRKIVDVTDVPLALFVHLYENKGQGCSREQLYYDAYLPAAEPDTNPDTKEYTDKCAHLLESAILRLRKAIEPDPRKPTYVVTDRGFGYKLQNVV